MMPTRASAPSNIEHAAHSFDDFSSRLILYYLAERQQCVRGNEIDTGVPQGSMWEPELSKYYSNDIFQLLSLQIANYADNNSPFCTAATISQVK